MSNASSKPAKPPEPAAAATPADVAVAATGKRGAVATWGPGTAVIMTAIAMAGAYLVAGLVAYVLPQVMGWSHSQTEDWFSSVLGQFLFVVLAEAIIVAIIIGFLYHRKTSIRAVGFHRKPSWKDLGYVLASFGLYFVAVAVITSLANAFLHVDLDQKQELGFDTVISHRDMALTFASLVLIPPIVEEFLFRGFLFTGLRKRLPFWWATVITSALFASLHLAEGAGGLLWVAGIDTFILSLFLCYLREKTGNLWAGIALHALKNSVAFLYLYVFVSR